MYYLIILKIKVQNRSYWTKNQVVIRAAFFLEALGENLLACFSQLLQAACVPWLAAPPSIFRASRAASANLSQTLPFPLFLKIPLWLHWAQLAQSRKISKLKMFELVISTKYLLLCKVTSSHILGIRMWTSLGATILPSRAWCLECSQHGEATMAIRRRKRLRK